MSREDFPFKRTNIKNQAKYSQLNKRTLIFCDPNESKDNTQIETEATAAGVTIVRVRCTQEALAFFDSLGEEKYMPERFMRVITNNTRNETADGAPGPTQNFAAGPLLVKRLRERNYSGPILVFCGNAKRTQDALGDEAHAMVTTRTPIAVQFATFKSMNTTFTSLFADAEKLKSENVNSRTVKTDEVQPLWEHALKSRKLAMMPLSISIPDAVQYTKYYIDAATVSRENNTHRDQIFHMVEDLVYRQCALGPKAPKILRVIVIDNPRLRNKFERAMAQIEDRTDLGWDHSPEDKAYIDILNMFIPESKYTRARPMLAFHSTHDKAEQVICAEGFRMEFIGGNTGNEGWYGKGNYFTSFPTYAHWYQGSRTAVGAVGSICFLMSWVLIGKPQLMSKVDIGCSQTPGATTHYAVTRRTRPAQESPTEMPDGDEIVSFDDAQSLPQFVVEMDVPPP
jgi:hypothetical protein